MTGSTCNERASARRYGIPDQLRSTRRFAPELKVGRGHFLPATAWSVPGKHRAIIRRIFTPCADNDYVAADRRRIGTGARRDFEHTEGEIDYRQLGARLNKYLGRGGRAGHRSTMAHGTTRPEIH